MTAVPFRAVFAPDCLRHDPQHFLVRGERRPAPEKPARGEAIAAFLAARGHPPEAPPAAERAALAAVHSAYYLAFLETAHARWQALGDAAPEGIPNVFRGPGMESYPRHVVGQAGYHLADTACPIGPHTWTAAVAAADSAVHAARLVVDGAARASYAVCRPPGHHAGRDRAGGFCYLNNAAVAAQACLPLLAAQGRPARVAILDVDVHAGNGTQQIFWERADVLTASVHADPDEFYPFLAGHAHERGAGPGEGFAWNRPLPIGASEDRVLEEVADVLARLQGFAPEVLLVSLGFDTWEHDPLAAFGVTPPGFARLGALIAGAGWPTVLVQEGGYAVDALQANLGSFLDGFLG